MRTARRLALAALLALIGWQVVEGLVSELTRLREGSLSERLDSLSLDTTGRYRKGLGEGADWIAEVRPHLAAGNTLLVVHDGSIPSTRLAAGFSVLLFPLRVSTMAVSAGEPAPWPELPATVLVAQLGPRDRFTQSLVEMGLAPLVHHDGFQLLGRSNPDERSTLDAGDGAHVIGPPAPPPAMRLHGWRLITMLAAPLVWGVAALRALGIRRRADPLAYWGWAWMLGCLLIGLALLGWMLLGQRLSALTPAVIVVVTTVVGGVGLVLKARPARPSELSIDERAGPGWERVVFAVCLGLALALLGDRIVLASGKAVVGGDEAGIWAAKAKALWAADGLGAPFGQLATAVAHPDYPLLDPLLQVFPFTLAGRPLDFENRLLIQLCVPALLLVAAGALRRCVRPSVAGLLLLLLATARQSGVSTADACADGLVALGLLAALDAGERWRASGERRWFILAALALTFLVGSKNEGLMLGLAAVTASLLTGAARDARASAARAGRHEGLSVLALAPWLLLPLALASCRTVLNTRFGLESDLLAPIGGVSLPERIVRNAPLVLLPVLRWVGSFLLRGGVETHLLIAAGLALLLVFPRLLLLRDASGRSPPYRALPATVLLALAGYLAIYVSGAPDTQGLDGWLRTSFPRLSYHVFPVLVVWLGAATTWLAARPASEPADPPGLHRPHRAD